MSVRGTIGYLNPELNNPNSTMLGDSDTRKKTTAKHEKLIHDARQRAVPPTLDANGVQLAQLVTTLKTFEEHHDKALLRKVLYPEGEAFAKRLTGASYATVIGSVVRSEDAKAEGKLSGLGAFTHAYARFAHLDAQDEKSEAVCRKMLTQRCDLSAEQANAGAMHVAMVNVWKPYDREVAQNPLTVLDCASLQQEDVVTTLYSGAIPGGKGISQLWERDTHSWLYWPKMGVEEALVFKQMDTRPNVAKYGFHQSFDDPTAPNDAPGRRSVELRIVLGFPKDGGGSSKL